MTRALILAALALSLVSPAQAYWVITQHWNWRSDPVRHERHLSVSERLCQSEATAGIIRSTAGDPWAAMNARSLADLRCEKRYGGRR